MIRIVGAGSIQKKTSALLGHRTTIRKGILRFQCLDEYFNLRLKLNGAAVLMGPRCVKSSHMSKLNGRQGEHLLARLLAEKCNLRAVSVVAESILQIRAPPNGMITVRESCRLEIPWVRNFVVTTGPINTVTWILAEPNPELSHLHPWAVFEVRLDSSIDHEHTVIHAYLLFNCVIKYVRCVPSSDLR